MELSLFWLLFWMSIELILCVSVTTIMAWSLEGGGELRLAPLAGDILLGNVAVFLIPNIIAFQAFRLKELRVELVALRRKYTTETQMAPTDQSINFYDKGGRLAFSTRIASVLYIEAADNYANIHYLNDEKEDTSLHLLRLLRIILSIILFIILACVIWLVPITSWWMRLIVAIIAVAIIVLFH